MNHQLILEKFESSIRSLTSAGQRRAASERLRLALANHPMPTALLEKLASSLGSREEWSLALAVCHHLTRVDPTSPDAWFGVAFYQERIGFPPEVIVTPYRRAYLLSRSVCSRIHLARILSQLESWREAYLLICDIPLEHLTRKCWAQIVFQINLANQDYAKAEEIRRLLSQTSAK